MKRGDAMKKKTKTSLSIDPEILAKVKEVALAENRNVSNVIETALIEYIKKKER